MAFLFDSLLSDIFTNKQEIMNLDITQNSQEYMSIYAPQTTYSPTITLPQQTISPSLQYNPQFIINSAGASATGGIVSPTVTQSQTIMPTVTPTQTVSPTQTTSQSAKQDAAQSMGWGSGGDWTTIAIIGIIGVAAYLILTNKQGKKNVKRYSRKAKGYAKKGAKAAKYAAMVM